MGNTLEASPRAAPVPPPLLAAARMLRGLAWVCALVPAGFLVWTFPVGFLFLLWGGIIVVGPPVALAILGFRLSRSLRRGHHVVPTLVFAAVQGCALLALSLHSTTWDPQTPGAGAFYWVTTFATFLGGAASLGAAVLVAAGAKHVRSTPGDLELRPRLWPWVLAGGRRPAPRGAPRRRAGGRPVASRPSVTIPLQVHQNAPTWENKKRRRRVTRGRLLRT